MNSWTRSSLEKDFLYKAQQIEIKSYLDELYTFLNKYNLMVKKVNNYYKKRKISKNMLCHFNNFRKNNFSKIIKIYNILRKKIFSLKNIDLKKPIQFGGVLINSNDNEIKKLIRFNIWGLSKNLIRMRYDPTKYPPVKRKKKVR